MAWVPTTESVRHLEDMPSPRLAVIVTILVIVAFLEAYGLVRKWRLMRRKWAARQ